MKRVRVVAIERKKHFHYVELDCGHAFPCTAAKAEELRHNPSYRCMRCAPKEVAA